MVRRKSRLDKHELEYMTRQTEISLKYHPKLSELYNILTGVGGKYIYLDATDSAYWMDILLRRGKFIYPVRISHEMSRKCKFEPFLCYQNLLAVYPPKHLQRKASVYIGYSLMEIEDCWIQHTWMYDGKTVYETTPIRSLQYFGVSVEPVEVAMWLEEYRWRLP